MENPKIVLTGAPGSGKSELIERLRREPAFRDFVFFSELARRLLVEKPDLRADRARFHREIYRRQIEREERAASQPVITDRGTVDAFAFHPETAQSVGTTIEREFERYTAVIQLGTAARLGREYYRRDEVRTESPEDALAIEQAITEVWRNHRHYYLIPATIDYEAKYGTLVECLQEIIGKVRSED